MPQGDQVKNGKAFEYALANAYAVFVGDKGKNENHTDRYHWFAINQRTCPYDPCLCLVPLSVNYL